MFRPPGFLITFALRSASTIGGTIAPLLVDRKKIERIKNVPYGSGVAQRLDVYLPRNRLAGKKLPVSLLVHGGGFRFFSKESHASAAARLAESGRIVFCIDFRLAPKHPFPEGLFDVAVAYEWIVENAERFGGDLARISIIGESSGAGLSASLCLHLFGIRKFPASTPIPPTPSVKPKAVILHCGCLEVSDIDRFRGDPRCHALARMRIAQIRRVYLPKFVPGGSPEWALADPLADPLAVFREVSASGNRLPNDFPEFFIPVGELDPIIGDSERLALEMAKLGQADRLRVYPGVGHAFYVSPSGTQAKRCWADIVSFLERIKA